MHIFRQAFYGYIPSEFNDRYFRPNVRRSVSWRCALFNALKQQERCVATLAIVGLDRGMTSEARWIVRRRIQEGGE